MFDKDSYTISHVARRNGNGSTSSLKINPRSHLRAIHLRKKSKLSSSLWKRIKFNLSPFLLHLCNAELRKIIVIRTFDIPCPFRNENFKWERGKDGKILMSLFGGCCTIFSKHWCTELSLGVWSESLTCKTSYRDRQGKEIVKKEV